MSRRVLAGLVLVAWAGVVGWHVKREYFKSQDVILAEGAASLAPGTYFYLVRMNDQPVGLATSRLDTVAGGFVFEDVMSVDVPAMDTVHRAVVRTRIRFGPALQLRSFTFELDSEIGRYAVEGVVPAEDSVVELTLETGGRTQRSTVPLEAGTLPAALPLRMAAAGRIRVGGTYNARLFDPSTLSDREVTVRVTGRDTIMVPDSVEQRPGGEWYGAGMDTVPVWRVEESYGGVEVTSWLDEDGRLIQATSPLGFTLERTAYEIAVQELDAARADPGYASGYGTIIESTAIASNVDLDATGFADVLRVRLGNVGLEGFDLAGGRQELRGDTLVIRPESPRQVTASYTLPYTDGGPPAEALGASALIQASEPRIQEKARAIVGDVTDPARAALRLNNWVHRELAKEITLSVPSATQVLDAREGDCNEHTVLYVALARAVGLPTRTAVGLVYIRGRFYYHAWPEVWLDRWVAVDPTLGQFPADATHLRFLVGGLARQVELIRLIGRLELEVL